MISEEKTLKFKVPEGEYSKAAEWATRFEAQLRALKIAYEVHATRTTIKVFPEGEGIRAREFITLGLSSQELNFIKKVKRHFLGLGGTARIRGLGESTYWNRFNETFEAGEYSNICEIDITAAYWNCANNLGYLSESLFLEGMDTTKIRKTIRLISLGALAKKTEILRYKPPYKGFQLEVKEEETAVYWDNITYECNKVMGEAYSVFKDGILGFWVDALFVRSDIAPMVIAFFRGNNYDMKLIPLKKIEVIEFSSEENQLIRHFYDGTKKELPPYKKDGKKLDSFKVARERFLSKLSEL